MATEPILQDPDANAAALEVRDLVKRYSKSKTNAVDGVSFEVSRGEIFGLLGPNGAGKTTIIGALTTFIVPTSGSATIMGIDIVRHPIDIKQRIAVVPQQSNLDRSLKVREILTFHAAYHGVPRKQREALADKLLDELGLGERKNEKVNRYSGGMAQRLMIARALMHAPDVLFLDEPTNNLDPQSRLFLWERIQDLNALGLTVLLTTHDMDEADKLCHRIAIMDHGKILVNGTPAELKRLIPGGSVLELRAYAPVEANAAVAERLAAALRALPGVTKVDEVADEPAAPAPSRGPGPGGPGPGGPGPGGPGPGGAWTGGGPPGTFAAPAAAPAEPGILVYRVYADAANRLVGAAAQSVVAAGAEVRDLSVKQPSLEEVFIFLTGRHLR